MQTLITFIRPSQFVSLLILIGIVTLSKQRKRENMLIQIFGGTNTECINIIKNHIQILCKLLICQRCEFMYLFNYVTFTPKFVHLPPVRAIQGAAILHMFMIYSPLTPTHGGDQNFPAMHHIPPLVMTPVRQFVVHLYIFLCCAMIFLSKSVTSDSF